MPSYLDLAVVIIVLVSGLLALLRGFTRETLAIASWVAAAAAAYYFHPLAIPYIKPYVQKDNIAMAAAAASVFFVALIVVSLFTVKLSDMILDSKIGPLDRTLGFIFGAARGVLLAVVAYLLYGWLVPENGQAEWVKNAKTRPILAAAGAKITDMLPDDLAETIVNKIKAKKGAPANEEPPAEPEADAAKTQPGETPAAESDKKPEAAPAEAPAQKGGAANGAKPKKR